MSKKAFTLEQEDRIIGVLKQFTADVAKAASDAIKELSDAKADAVHQHTVSDISNFPASLPANGGNAATVNGHSVAANVPVGAKFTDTVYTHPMYAAKSSGLYKITVDTEGHVSAVTAVTKADITALGIPAQDTNTTYGVATQSANGLLSAADKKKLDGVAEGANKYVHPAYADKSSGLYKVTVDGTGHVSAVSSVSKADILAFGISPQEIGAAAASHTHVITGSASIPVSGWKTDSNTKFPYYYDLAISGVTASDRVDLNVAIVSVDTAIACGLCPLTEAFAGKVRLRAKKAPTAAVSVEYWIMKK